MRGDRRRPWLLAAGAVLLPVWLVAAAAEPAALLERGHALLGGGLPGWAGLGLLLHAAALLVAWSLRRPEVRRRRAFALVAVGLGALVAGLAAEGVLRLAPGALPRGARRYLDGPARPFRLSEPRFCVYDGPWRYRGQPHLELPPLPTQPELVREGRVRPHPLAEPSELVGIRYDAHGLRNPPDRERADLVAVGDSFTFGWNLPREVAWPARVEALTGAPAYACAFNAWGPSQALAAFEAFGLPRRPEVVVWTFYEGNDLEEEVGWRAWQAKGAPVRSAAEVAAAEPPLEGARLLALGAWLLDRLPPGVYRHAGSPRPAPVAEVGGRRQAFAFAPGRGGPGGPRGGGLAALAVDPAAWRAHPGLAPALDAIARGRDQATAQGARFVCLLVPTKERVLYPLLPPTERRAALARAGARVDPAALDALVLERRGALLDLVRTELERRGVAVLDLREPLTAAYTAGHPPYFALDSHWNRKGHAVAAEVVAGWLRGGG